jgi:hypothetical protein
MSAALTLSLEPERLAWGLPFPHYLADSGQSWGAPRQRRCIILYRSASDLLKELIMTDTKLQKVVCTNRAALHSSSETLREIDVFVNSGA